MSSKNGLFLVVCLLTSSIGSWANDDEIDFFNVGQGHAVLVNRVGRSPLSNEPYAPLLIDAGSSSLPNTPHEQYRWEKTQSDHFVSKITSKILNFWKASTNNTLQGENYKLNVIVTHGDDDHRGLVPLILRRLEEKKDSHHFTFTPFLLLGGNQRHYETPTNFLNQLRTEYPRTFSRDWPRMSLQGQLYFLETSGCITHLYCPIGTGKNKDENTWSIIARLKVNGISAVITGDADATIKTNMIASLGGQEAGLKSDILLLPHHGAEGTFQANWDEQVNPKAIVVGSAPHGGLLANPIGGYRHPRGEPILNSLRLFQGRGHIWNKVRAHAVEYYCHESFHEQIQDAFRSHENYLFERVPNAALSELEQQPGSRWHLIWIDTPIYTLWTTGSLFFTRDVTTPQYIDAPHGLMSYVAVPNSTFLFDPYRRENLRLLSEEEDQEYQKVLGLIRSKYIEKHIEKLGASYSRMFMKELYLMDKPADRGLYLYALSKVFTEIKPLEYMSGLSVMCETPSFQWLREAVINKRNEIRFREAVDFLFRSYETLVKEGDDNIPGDCDLNVGLCDENLEGLVYILKTFSRSHHTRDSLRSYIGSLSKIMYHGFSVKDVDALCPSGYPEWLQLERLAEFGHALVCSPVNNPYDEGLAPPSPAEIFRTLPLRLEGKNFKEIAKNLIEDEEMIKLNQELAECCPEEFEGLPTTPKELQQKLEEYFPPGIDLFLT